MTASLNKAGERHATALISAGKYDADSAWSFDAADGDKLLGDGGNDWANYAQWFLGEDTSATDKTKERYKYPFGKDGKVYRAAVRAIRSRASQQGDTAVFEAAGRMMEAMDKKDGESEDGKQGARPRVERQNGRRQTFAVAIESTRIADMCPESMDEQDRSVDVVASTGAAVRRSGWDGEYDEVLKVDPASVRLDRLNRGAPLIDSHDYCSGTSAMMGAVVPGTARVEGGALKARVKFSRSDLGERAFQDVKDGVLRHVSIGYVTHKQEIDDTQSPQVRTATDWEPYEVSAVPMPAGLFSPKNAPTP